MRRPKAPLVLLTASTQSQGAEFHDHSVSLSANYANAVAAAGGVPVIAPIVPSKPVVSALVARVDGVVLTGGDDIQTQLYQPGLTEDLKRRTSPPEPARDLFELLVIHEVLRQGKPLFAICRGLQLLNVALGGTLVVDIPTQRPGALNHRRMDMKDKIVHSVDIVPGSLLARLVGGVRLGVNSSHHQAVEKIAGLLKVTARSADGIVECLEMGPGFETQLPFLLAVQFHPERLAARHAAHRRLFEGFVRACSAGNS